MAATVRHETRALLRAHLSAASSYRHRTRHCPICRQLLRLEMDSGPQPAAGADEEGGRDEEPAGA
ncbi:DUF6274 family protein [Streptomyces mangrovisoli]|uniref:Uncharacterized protein n=1 Tax=Streptomyces mangrovisoli TaxID=1428628 RepID=A0A1J4P0R3_9ACTN|nr:DUF6274 family protein [Streptomyces mangrovisoli]OIJ67069.1 hypothetical protein WN71_015270 [Streptomyces mangrovisoli]